MTYPRQRLRYPELPLVQALPPGTVLRRRYKGAWVEVTVHYPSYKHRPGKYEYDGVCYPVLARAVAAILGYADTNPGAT